MSHTVVPVVWDALAYADTAVAPAFEQVSQARGVVHGVLLRRGGGLPI